MPLDAQMGIVASDIEMGKPCNAIPPNWFTWAHPTVPRGSKWHEPNNWKPYGVPGANDSVLFPGSRYLRLDAESFCDLPEGLQLGTFAITGHRASETVEATC